MTGTLFLGKMPKPAQSGIHHDFSFGGRNVDANVRLTKLLQAEGISVGCNGVVATVATEAEYVRALQLMWEHRIPGWETHRVEFERCGICTAEEHAAAIATEAN